MLDDLSVGEQCTIVNFTIAGLDCTGVAAPQPEHDSPTVSAEPVTTSPYDVVGKTLTQLQDDMQTGKTTSQQIVRGYLDRIAAYDTGQFGLHSFIKVADDAMAQARPPTRRALPARPATCSASRSPSRTSTTPRTCR